MKELSLQEQADLLQRCEIAEWALGCLVKKLGSVTITAAERQAAPKILRIMYDWQGDGSVTFTIENMEAGND